ncbi:hypothetical protein KVR01_010679 [Diaporthe batatas]|uniref:uncharacterized protein n=1 Tax=Diaporthe batatas TaxID=748121 RepID=UPI001D047245|nr:uncharacterized protein KVR01_010679 [Diaporthe batatas]KAG8160042.1 hypothetical protein KVR01_010679 [Diaporthe batatas]
MTHPQTGERAQAAQAAQAAQDKDWRHLPVTLSGGLSGVMACTQKSAVKKLETPLELFCHEQQRHERIAFMMRGDEHHHFSNKWPTDGHSTLSSSPSCQNRGHHEDILMKDGGQCAAAAAGATAAAANTKHSSSPFRVELEVNSGDNGEDDPHLQEIRIVARIKTERIQRRGQRECREGRVRKKIRMSKRPHPTEPG